MASLLITCDSHCHSNNISLCSHLSCEQERTVSRNYYTYIYVHLFLFSFPRLPNAPRDPSKAQPFFYLAFFASSLFLVGSLFLYLFHLIVEVVFVVVVFSLLLFFDESTLGSRSMEKDRKVGITHVIVH